MCGIIALFRKRRDVAFQPLLDTMLACQSHRGPDATGRWLDPAGDVALGHNRLAIVDLSALGNQPMASADGTLQITYNGEIYNWRELRAGLEAKGRRFRSQSDTEVILHLYAEYGVGLLEHLRGMFAFALWDARTQTLFVARDRLGKKPVILGESEAGLVVASEIPTARLWPGLDLSVDPTALGLYLLRNLRHVPDPWTFWRGLRRLPPGHALVAANGRVVRQWRYWTPSFETRTVSAEEVRADFDEAVALRRIADVEVAALLSGGVDSSGICQAMVAQGSDGLRTYALGRDRDDEELDRAQHMASKLGTRHRAFVFEPQRFHEHHAMLIRRFGEPIALLPLAHAYELCRQIRDDGVKVVMTGHGADELFYGYTGFTRQARLSRALCAMPAALRPLARAAAPLLPAGVARDGVLAAGQPPGRRKAALYADEAAHAPLAPISADVARDWLALWMADPPDAYIDESAAIGLMQENTHSVQIAGDLPAMAASVECRCPFLDHKLVELAWATPYRSKVSHGRLKAILKDALKGRVPDALLDAPKRGFGYHIQEAAVLSGPWKHAVDAAFARFDDLGGLLDRNAVLAVKQHFDARPDAVTAQLVAKLYAIQIAMGKA
jgi:asparagine synthase (glutamine-hydrolysing)